MHLDSPQAMSPGSVTSSLLKQPMHIAEVYSTEMLIRANPVWYEAEPRRLDLKIRIEKKRVYHFLLPDPGIAGYSDKVANRVQK